MFLYIFLVCSVAQGLALCWRGCVLASTSIVFLQTHTLSSNYVSLSVHLSGLKNNFIGCCLNIETVQCFATGKSRQKVFCFSHVCAVACICYFLATSSIFWWFTVFREAMVLSIFTPCNRARTSSKLKVLKCKTLSPISYSCGRRIDFITRAKDK